MMLVVVILCWAWGWDGVDISGPDGFCAVLWWSDGDGVCGGCNVVLMRLQQWRWWRLQCGCSACSADQMMIQRHL